MRFILFDENTGREYALDITDLEYDHWQVWCDKAGLDELLDDIDRRFGGIFEECSSSSVIGYKSFYFGIKDYPLMLRMFKRYFEACGYEIGN